MVTEALLRLALGWSWNEQPWLYLPDLEAAVSEGLPNPTHDGRARLAELIALITAQPPGTTASGLGKAMARAKVVAGTDKYQPYGTLIGLAESVSFLVGHSAPVGTGSFPCRAQRLLDL
ncbi:hypothetical protein GCM10011575_43860 [Microlunatus endophyticus]|uniref:Uncharacterized protein n=2 Tax=Microlunatus endophyticus TaxID=1716077 RepID=A0A917W818_9ACTN|nr:hypothetical protein GCM10011575_43860 [Microlunatus endophyticus]